MTEFLESGRPEEKLFLTVDFDGDFLELRFLAEDFKDKVHAVKLGQGFLLDQMAHGLQRKLHSRGTVTYLDAKYHEDPDQMDYVVRKSFELGYRYVSVAPSAGSAALVAAGLAQTKSRVVGALSSGDADLSSIEIRNMRSANNDLDEGNKLDIVMCNVSGITRVKELGDFTVIATGIRMPGDDICDQPAVATPAEALERGADFLAVGRAVTGHKNRVEALDRILENIATVR
ncbi:orotidine 5'-phosphate decarboxylase [Candidatus Saccharibacteria bacterium]|nr:orotidine 5'-phosphate decarboxylase [Candidatus Saccharibacteria bacterium]